MENTVKNTNQHPRFNKLTKKQVDKLVKDKQHNKIVLK